MLAKQGEEPMKDQSKEKRNMKAWLASMGLEAARHGLLAGCFMVPKTWETSSENDEGGLNLS